MKTKIDYSPLLRKIVGDKNQKPADIAKTINSVAPGAVSRRAVNSWLADHSSSESRPCDSKWIALLCYGMLVQGKFNLAEQQNIIKLMNEINQAAALRYKHSFRHCVKVVKNANSAESSVLGISPLALNLFDQSMRTQELRKTRHSSRFPSVQATRKMKIRAPSL